MEKAIIGIIDKKAANQYKRLTPTKFKAYRAMLYAGAQITLNGRSVREIAAEINYSESGTSKLVQKWIALMREGDVTVNIIISAINKMPKSERFKATKATEKITMKVDYSSTQEAANTEAQMPELKQKAEKPKCKNVLGFIITPEDEMRERAAIRSSILFFQDYGKGRQPRMNGEYYVPGTHTDASPKEKEKWLPLETAALYCGCSTELITTAAQCDMIERRVYKHSAGRNYYEYKVSDLNRFIKNNHLL